MMLHSGVKNGNVTHHVTPGLYSTSKFSSPEKEMGLRHNGLGEKAFAHNYNGSTTHENYYMKNKGRNSSDVDDGVISNDGDYDPTRQNVVTIEVEMETAAAASGYNNSHENPMRLSHAESTDSGMGFSDNPKDSENSRLSAGDGYGTIHMIKPPQEEPHNRKSLIDGDAEYEEVMEFISTPTQEQVGEWATTSTFETPKKAEDTEGNGSAGDSGSKYAELDLAKILHTRRRHRNTATLSRRHIEEKLPDESMFNSLKRKPKTKNYSFSGYATYGRNRKTSRQQNTDSWASRPSSTVNEEEVFPPLSDSQRITPSSPFDRQSNEVSPLQTHSNTFSARRNNFTDDLMMTSHVNDDVMSPSATLDRTTSWRTRPESPPVEVDTTFADMTHGSNRWSWLSNSSSQAHSHDTEKPSTPNKRSPWKIFRRMLGGGDSKHKHATSTTMSATSLSSDRSRSSSIFRRFSMRKNNKSHASKRRSSVPAKSEWDVHMPGDDGLDIAIHIPVMDAGKQRPVAPTALTQKSRGKPITGKNKHSKRSNDAITKGLSISSPQLAVNAIDPTRNYSEHQLLNLNNLSLNSDDR